MESAQVAPVCLSLLAGVSTHSCLSRFLRSRERSFSTSKASPASGVGSSDCLTLLDFSLPLRYTAPMANHGKKRQRPARLDPVYRAHNPELPTAIVLHKDRTLALRGVRN